MTVKELLNKGIIEKNEGHGLTSCYGCNQKGKWNCMWCCFTYKYKGNSYCSECITKLFKDEQK